MTGGWVLAGDVIGSGVNAWGVAASLLLVGVAMAISWRERLGLGRSIAWACLLYTSGTVHATMEDGSSRPFHLEVLGDTGVHLGAGLYFGFDGHHHGEFRGELHVDGERIADCRTPEAARRLHQIRDTPVRLTDPVGGGVGYGNCQPIAVGPWPELGLDDESWI